MTAAIAPSPRPSPARRFGRPGWRDRRLWLGVGLLAGSMVVGSFVLADRSDTVLVLRATRDLAVGAGPADLVAVAVPADVAGAYVRAAEDLTGTLRWPVTAGDLLPRAALGADDLAATRAVTVAVEPLHAPAGLAPGDRVDVWSTPSGTDGGMSSLVLASVPVIGVGLDDVGLGGSFGVTLRVPADRVGDVVRAGRGFVVDLVAVPIDAQAVGPTP